MRGLNLFKVTYKEVTIMYFDYEMITEKMNELRERSQNNIEAAEMLDELEYTFDLIERNQEYLDMIYEAQE